MTTLAGLLYDPPIIFSVLQEQLGLKLQAAKAPAEVAAIARIKRPFGN